MIYIIIALFIIRLKATNNLQRFKYKNDIKQYFTEMLKKTTYRKVKTVFMQRIYYENPPSFHMYNLAKLEACSEPCQMP